MLERLVFANGIEIRASRTGRLITGSFKYGVTAIRSDRGRVRKERIMPKAFRYAIDEDREINLLSGHEFSKPLASTKSGTLKLSDTDDRLSFEATLPRPSQQPTWIQDTVRSIRAGLIGGVSPGFKVPPLSVVPGAEQFVPDKDNPKVYVRLVNAAVLYELSLVTRASYGETTVDLRAADVEAFTAEYAPNKEVRIEVKHDSEQRPYTALPLAVARPKRVWAVTLL